MHRGYTRKARQAFCAPPETGDFPGRLEPACRVADMA